MGLKPFALDSTAGGMAGGSLFVRIAQHCSARRGRPLQEFCLEILATSGG